MYLPSNDSHKHRIGFKILQNIGADWKLTKIGYQNSKISI